MKNTDKNFDVKLVQSCELKRPTNMKIILLFLASVAYVACENCTINSQCTSTRCFGSDYHPICQHPHPELGFHKNGGLCTCYHELHKCVLLSDCDSYTMDCHALHKTCYDGKCLCTRF